MANRQNILQSLRHRTRSLGRMLLPAFAVTLFCPAGIVCADIPATAEVAVSSDSTVHAGHAGHAEHPGHDAARHQHGSPSSDHSDDSCPHCPAHASAMSAARAVCDVADKDAPPPAKLPPDMHLAAPPSTIPSRPAIPHPSPPRTAYSTGSGPPAVPLNLLHCVFLN